MRNGMTQVGPHRDDVDLLLDGRDLRTFGSAGQQRTAAITLRTLEAETLRDACAAAPVFLLDDPFAELDAARAERVLALLGDIGLGQTILAVPRETDIPRELTSLPRAIVSPGVVRAEWTA
jgi:DNA replication and repair protein RecF